MKHLYLAVLSTAIALGSTSMPAYADFIVIDEKPAASRAAKPAGAPQPLHIVSPQEQVQSPAATLVTAPQDPAKVVPAPQAQGSQGRLIQVGAPMPGPALEGWARDIPLSLALEQVVPDGWTVRVRGVDAGTEVSWRGGRSWHAIMGDMAYGYRFDARVDWVNQQVSIGPAGSQAPSVAGSPEPVRKEVSPIVTKEAPAPVVVQAPESAPVPVVPAQPAVEQWTLDPQKTLRENIEAWGQRAGWRVVWEGADYPVYAPAGFTGSFDSPEGPLATVIAAYDDSDQPLLARLHRKDKVAHVSNRGYVPTTVVPTSPSDISPSSFPNPGLDN